MPHEATIEVEVVYAGSREQVIVVLVVPLGTTAIEAVERSGLTSRFEVSEAPLGIYGRLIDRNTVLRESDRVEIYRPLAADPKHARRKRAARKPT